MKSLRPLWGALVILCVLVFGMIWFIKSNLGSATSSSAVQQENSVAATAGLSLGRAEVPTAAPAPKVARDMADGVSAPLIQNNQQRLIIKTGSLSVLVQDVPEAVIHIQEYAKTKGGFVVSSNISKDRLAPYGEVTIRISSQVFDGGVQEIKSLGEVKSERVNGQDVTEEFTDLNAQLRNLRVTETQFLEIMKRAVRIEDVLSVQREITRVQGEIEVLQGRIKYLEQSAQLSTLTVYLSTNPQDLPVVDADQKWKPLAVLKDAVRNLIELGKGIVSVLIWFVVYTPVWAILGVVVWLVRKWWRKQKS